MRTEIKSVPTGLTTDSIQTYREQGYLLLDDVVDPESLSAAWRALVTAESSTPVQRSDRYNKDGKVDFSKTPNLAKHREEFRMLACAPPVVTAVEALLGQRALIFRDVLVNKPAHDGAPLDYHQDSAYWDIRPPELVSAWITFRDVGPADGCLRVIRGSQSHEYPHDVLLGKSRALPGWMTGGLRRLATMSGTGDSDASGFSPARRLKNGLLGGLTRHLSFLGKLQDLHARVPIEDKEGAVDLPVRAGSVVLFHSRLLHASNPNTSDKDRPAYIVSYMGSEYTFCGVGQPEFLIAREIERKVFQKARIARH
jgi:ectoine hydroxylase-related dioxygenase (phytanoyl-CoA dioxygenase family)